MLGAYIYLKSKETKDDQLFRTIVQNLQNKILVENLDAPDLWALNLLSYEHFNETFTSESRTSINGTPMLRIAYDTIKRAASRYRWLVPEGSFNDLRIDLLTARLVVNFFFSFWRFNNGFTRNKVIHQWQRCRFYSKLLAPCSRFACVFLVAVLFSITYHDISR